MDYTYPHTDDNKIVYNLTLKVEKTLEGSKNKAFGTVENLEAKKNIG